MGEFPGAAVTASSLAGGERGGHRSALMLLCGFLSKGSAQGLLPRSPGIHLSPETSDHIQPCLTPLPLVSWLQFPTDFLPPPQPGCLPKTGHPPCFSAAAAMPLRQEKASRVCGVASSCSPSHISLALGPTCVALSAFHGHHLSSSLNPFLKQGLGVE